jgi:hypothetical protein
MAVVTFFQSMRDKFSSWDSLKDYLTSEEGGQFEVRDCENTPFAIIKYNRSTSRIEGDNGWLRAVVWHKEKNLPVCVSPKKSFEGLPPVNTNTEVQNIIDGVMVNVFACFEADGSVSYHMATRSSYGAKTTFYSNKSFAELFQDALAEMGYPGLEKLFAENHLPTSEYPFSYLSCVLQHPEHRIVARCEKASIKIVESGKVKSNGEVLRNVNIPLALAVQTVDQVSFATEQEFYEYMRQNALQHGWRWPGLMLRDTQGNRWRVRSQTYAYLRSLRGNEASSEARFLRLRAAGQVREYLKHYSDERNLFWDFETKLRQRTADIYAAYVAVHKSHEKKLADIPQPDKTVVFKLHAHFLANLREQNKKVLLADVIQLVNALPLWEQALLLK